MHYILGTLALLGLGLIGLLIETHKQDRRYIEELKAANATQASYADSLELQIESTEKYIANLDEVIANLVSNQKPIPWNKGKKGYKLNRKPKTHKVDYTSSSNDGHILFTPRID